MIIHEIKCRVMTFAVVVFFLMAPQIYGQALEPAPTFNMLGSGYGARALGLGGAFIALADDITAIYWNPAGLGQVTGIQLHADYRFQGDSDEDFAAEAEPNTFTSAQRYEISGNQFQSVSGSYAIEKKTYTIVPAVSWQRMSSIGPERSLKETAGLVSFIDPRNLIFVQSEGQFDQEFEGGEDELAFGVGVRVHQRVLFGASWSLLRGGVDAKLNGTFHDNFIPGIDEPNVRQDITLEQSREEDLSGNYFRAGILYAAPAWSIGGYVRLPHTRKSDITLTRKGSVVTNGVPSQFNEKATAESEIEVPAEFGGAVLLRASQRYLITGSVAYANWEDATYAITNSSNPLLIPETVVSYPTLRPTAGQQYSLLQLRAGTEYMLAGNLLNGFAVRAGIFRNGQPYANESGDRETFKGYSFGAGYFSSSYNINVAYIREKGELTFTPYSQGESAYRNERWVISVDIIGR